MPELPDIPQLCSSPVSDDEIPQAAPCSAPLLTSALTQSPKAFKRSLTTVGDAINDSRLKALRAHSMDGLFNFDAIASLTTYDAEEMGWNTTPATPTRGESEIIDNSAHGTTLISIERNATSAALAPCSEASSTEGSDAGTEMKSPAKTRPSFRLPEHEIKLMREELKHLREWNGHALSREDDAKIRSLWLDTANRRDWHLQHRVSQFVVTLQVLTTNGSTHQYAVPLLQNPHTIFLPPSVQCRCCAKGGAPLLPGKPDDPPLVRRKWPCLIAFKIINGDVPIVSSGCCLSCSLRKASCSLQKAPVTGISVVDGMPSLPTVVVATKGKGSQGRKSNPQRVMKSKSLLSTMKTRSSEQDLI